jgi:TonB family protein
MIGDGLLVTAIGDGSRHRRRNSGLGAAARRLSSQTTLSGIRASRRRPRNHVLKLQVLENGRVGEVVIEQSAGHPDLDMEAAGAVKKWLFEPARVGKQPVAVWVLLPVKFELN